MTLTTQILSFSLAAQVAAIELHARFGPTVGESVAALDSQDTPNKALRPSLDESTKYMMADSAEESAGHTIGIAEVFGAAEKSEEPKIITDSATFKIIDTLTPTGVLALIEMQHQCRGFAAIGLSGGCADAINQVILKNRGQFEGSVQGNVDDAMINGILQKVPEAVNKAPPETLEVVLTRKIREYESNSCSETLQPVIDTIKWSSYLSEKYPCDLEADADHQTVSRVLQEKINMDATKDMLNLFAEGDFKVAFETLIDAEKRLIQGGAIDWPTYWKSLDAWLYIVIFDPLDTVHREWQQVPGFMAAGQLARQNFTKKLMAA